MTRAPKASALVHVQTYAYRPEDRDDPCPAVVSYCGRERRKANCPCGTETRHGQDPEVSIQHFEVRFAHLIGRRSSLLIVSTIDD